MLATLSQRLRSEFNRGRAKGRSRRVPRGRPSWPLWLEALEPRTVPSFLAPRSFDAGIRPYSVAVADVNGDRQLDFAVANEGSNTVSVLLGNGDGTFQAAQNFLAGRGPVAVAVGAFNGDDHLDLAVANSFSDNVSIFLGNGDGTFQAARNFPAGNGPFSVAVGEVTGDGVPDLAVADRGSDHRASVLTVNG